MTLVQTLMSPETSTLVSGSVPSGQQYLRWLSKQKAESRCSGDAAEIDISLGV